MKEQVIDSENLFGMHGKILKINLSNRQTSILDVPRDSLHKFLGGKALGMSLLSRDLLRVDSLSEENKLGFFTGPLTGFVPGGGSCTAVTKSPLTETLTDPVCQGYFGEAIKYSGYDGIIIEGKSEKPIYLFISDKEITIKPADDLVGLSTSETETMLKERHFELKHVSVASIGQAGENLVRFASVIADKRAFGRGGAGAVMGTKNLKAIIIGGNSLPQVYDRKLLREKIMQISQHVKQNHKFKIYEIFGTIGVFDKHKKLGSLSGNNYRTQEMEQTGLSTMDLVNQSVKKTRACSKCLINCSRESTVSKSDGEVITNGPEFESAWALGPNIGSNSAQLIAMADFLCDEYGIDTLSTGATIAFFQECVDKGLIKYEQKIDPLDLIKKIVNRKDVGDILAEGTKRAAEKIHPEAISLITVIKGLETPAYDPRGFYGIALSFAISKRGGCHRKAFCSQETEGKVSGLEISGKPELVVNQETKNAWVDSLGICKWVTGGLQAGFYPEIIYAITGETITDNDLELIGRRAINIAQMFNRQQGYRRMDDTLPKRFLTEKRNDKDNPVDINVLEQMKDV